MQVWACGSWFQQGLYCFDKRVRHKGITEQLTRSSLLSTVANHPFPHKRQSDTLIPSTKKLRVLEGFVASLEYIHIKTAIEVFLWRSSSGIWGRWFFFFSEIFAIPFLWSCQAIWLLNLMFLILTQKIRVLVWGQDCSAQILDQGFPKHSEINK